MTIFYGHRRLGTAIQLAPDVWKKSLLDIETFIGDAQRQITHKLDQGFFDAATENVIRDLQG